MATEVLKTQIIPKTPWEVSVEEEHVLDLKAIAVFTAVGFFLESDTYWKDRKVLTPGAKHWIDSRGYLKKSTPYFKWSYRPEVMSFEQALEKYATLLETIVKEQTQGKKVILPLSGGLDSRTLAVALQSRKEQVKAFSYKFERGYDEVRIAREVAAKAGFRFNEFEIKQGYLWDRLDTLAQLNKCASDFTSPRQMAVREDLKPLGEVFSLGHWGDVLFDDMKVEDTLDFEGQVDVVKKKLLKSGGLQLAGDLWNLWGLEGTVETYIYERIRDLLAAIDMPHSANAQIRAFKSLYWATRWTSVNLAVFESVHPITLPYYDNRMCEFICTLPEEFLKQRKLQIAYIKMKAPELAGVTWQDHRPFNLWNYNKDKLPYNLPYKLNSKLKRTLNKALGKPYVMRNWELQFLGQDNKNQVSKRLYDKEFLDWIPRTLVDKVVNSFYKSPTPGTAHPLNMLLVLAKFNELKNRQL